MRYKSKRKGYGRKPARAAKSASGQRPPTPAKPISQHKQLAGM